ncbi:MULTISPECIES: Lrp/AsnC family transcriptional regulator [unclassified Nesterenkonia]|uniref:Lrp/AsnC family transcriptional regulator n=1 Tax=unclassified Nesterenkonia TaxID=2629769 RepID=UPI0008726CFC|nr:MULTISPECIES: Lrp/AsnC ligand binding domain-containing protein [unclassified Nesterenkonia]MDS2173947.1 Lrp/AsnC ligand binding domain-containing protein [Nesterenkonia sp. CL21]OSM44293.1 AsnC family transcriptional regulator [Nesterenkonia sp. PF2B19]
MVTAFVMIKTDPQGIPEAGQQIADIDGVQAVYSVTGPWDLVAMVKGPSFDELAELIPDRISKVSGIRDTETLLAFRTYSDQDLEAGFALGLDD